MEKREGRVQGIKEEKRNLHTWKGFKMLLGNSVEWESGWGSCFLHARGDELDMHRFPPILNNTSGVQVVWALALL